MSKKKVYRVDRVATTILKIEPPVLLVEAYGKTRTSGWRHAELVLNMGPVDPPSDTASFDFIVLPPTGMVTQAVTPIDAETRMDPMPQHVRRICVQAETNEITVSAGESKEDPEAIKDGADQPFPEK